MRKVTTGCCAMCQIDKVNNDTPKEALEYAIAKLGKEKLENTEVGISTGNGQTSAFVIVSPGENILEANLKDLGFLHVHTFERRVGYPPGLLKMYIKNV